MRFGPWYALASAADEAPETPGVFQVRRASGLTEYPSGKSAMVHYAASAELRGEVGNYAAEHADQDWLCRHSELADLEAAKVACARLLDQFRRRFGSEPGPPLRSIKLRLADRHARLLWEDGRAADRWQAEFDALLEAAAPVVDAIAQANADLRAVSVDFNARVLRATFDTEAGVKPIRMDGEQFERAIAPSCAALVAAVGGSS